MTVSDLGSVLARRITVLGSTGSVGVSTIDVIEHVRKEFGRDALPVEALTAQTSVEMLAAQARRLRARHAVIGDESLYPRLRELLQGTDIEVAAGSDAVIAAAARPSDVAMVAIVGFAGLAPALAAVARGALIALANKECVVAGGAIFRDAVRNAGATIVPVDSEHNAAFQILDFDQSHAIERLTLTASGGPFREWPLARMALATPEQAVAHPKWSMGAKISVDSATLMNKGLELIEAQQLFALSPDQLAVVVHPQSIVHCLVSYADGSTLAHLSEPDMRTPIAYALGWPRRLSSPSRRLNLAEMGSLSFESADLARFPCLGLAENCLHAGGLAPTILNAANEIAVRAFLARQIRFLDIARVVEATLAVDGVCTGDCASLDGILDADRQARRLAGDLCHRVAA